MRSRPYQGIRQDLVEVLERLLVRADNYHNIHRARFARTLEVLLDVVPENGRLLELGTSGLFPAVLQEMRPDVEVVVTHFDESAEKVGEFSSNFSGVPIVRYALDLEKEALPCEDESFDVVVCCEVLEHMEVDPMFMLSEVNRVTKPGGKLLLTTPNIASSRGLSKLVQGYEPYFYMKYRKDASYHRHNFEYSVHGVYAVMKCAGFEPNVWTEDLFEDPLMDIPNKLIDAGFEIVNLGDNIVAVGEKVSGVTKRYPSGLYD
jgi:SAM-dependent methyltransferase